MMKIPFAFAGLLLIVPSARLAAQAYPASQQSLRNAAVAYLRADASLRQSYPLPTDAPAKLQKALESPLDDEDEKLVAAADEALIEFHHGASSKLCDWEISAEDGALANTAHRGAIIELASVSGLRARLRFRAGNAAGAISDVLAAMGAARHLSVDGSLASVLFAYKLENTLSGIIAQNLFDLSPEQLTELTTDLDGLPPGFSLGTAFLEEKVHRHEILDIAEEAKSRDQLVEMLLKRVPILQSNPPSAIEIVEGCGGTVQGFLNCAGRQQAFYKEWSGRFSWSPEKFEREYNFEIKEASSGNPVVLSFTPALPRLRWAEAYCQTRRALLQAAIAVVLHGPNTLDRHPDPYDAKPFSYAPVDNGFRLQSRLQDNGVPLSLSITTR
jgi:hypothetical protein